LNAYNNSHLTAVISNNTITMPLDTAVTIYSKNTSTLCSNLSGNTLNAGGGSDDIKLEQADTSTFDVVDYPNLGANNGGASVLVVGGSTITSVVGCP